jgi:hypothetical protein
MSLDTLRTLSASLLKTVQNRLIRRQDKDVLEATWAETQEELARGWIFEHGEDSLEGKVVAMRFGLRQGQKIRVIDDCSICCLNATVGLWEKLQVHSIDILANMLQLAMRAGPKGALPQARGRTYDLKSAYRQFGMSEESRRVLRFAVNGVDGSGPHYYGMNTLPFGAVSSVASFLRLRLSIWFIGFAALRLLWTNFYDDFSLVSASRLENSAAWAAENLFDLLGVVYAKEGKKFLPFSTAFQTLGVRVDLEHMQEGTVSIGHTDSRKEELLADIASILAAGRLSSKEAERLRGRTIFQSAGRWGPGVYKKEAQKTTPIS